MRRARRSARWSPLLLGVLSGFAAGAQTGNEPGLALEPASGPPSSPVAVRGSGFADQCGVSVRFGSPAGPPLGTVGVGEGGAFEAAVVIPTDAAEGTHRLVAVGLLFEDESCGEPSGVRASAPFEVEPFPLPPLLKLDAFETVPGSTVSIEGRRFCGEAGCSPVTISIDSEIVASDVAVEPDGTFQIDVMVPGLEAAGTVAVEAVQKTPGGIERFGYNELVVTVRPDLAEPVID